MLGRRRADGGTVPKVRVARCQGRPQVLRPGGADTLLASVLVGPRATGVVGSTLDRIERRATGASTRGSAPGTVGLSLNTCRRRHGRRRGRTRRGVPRMRTVHARHDAADPTTGRVVVTGGAGF